jgi:K+-transporting ATPase KdpF subunit
MRFSIDFYEFTLKEDFHGYRFFGTDDSAGGTVAGIDRSLPGCARRWVMITALSGICAVLLLVYLTVAMLKPEWF